MPIVASRARDIQRLIDQLGDARPSRRDSAVAQLTLLGERAVERLLASLPAATPAARLGILSVLGRLRDSRARAPLLKLIEDEDESVARLAAETAASDPDPRAVEPLSRALASPRPAPRRTAAAALARLHAAGVVEALAPLLDRLFDEAEDAAVRGLALEAVSLLGPRQLKPVLERLRATSGAELADRIEGLQTARPTSRRSEDVREPMAEGPAAIPRLRRRLEELSERLAAGEAPGRIAQEKARLHVALAGLGSRIALHDLREMLQARPCRAAEGLLEAAGRLADPTLLPAIVGLAADEAVLFEACASVFTSTARRARLRRNSRALKTVKAAHRETLERMWRRLHPA